MDCEPSTNVFPVASTSSPSYSSSQRRSRTSVPLPNGVTAADVEECLRQLVLKSRRTPLLQPERPQQRDHECNPACDFFVHGDMWVCRLTNRMHVCSLSKCNRLTTDGDEDSQVCEVTACCYSLNFVMSSEMEMNSGMHSQMPKTRAPDTAVCKRNRDQSDPTVAAKQKAETENIMKEVMGSIRINAGCSLYQAVNTTLLAETVHRLWRACVNTNEFKAQPYRYRHRYHVFVVLYNSIKGLKHGDQELITPNTLIRRYLPEFRVLAEQFKTKTKKTEKTQSKSKLYDVSTLTKTNKIFLACMRELYPTANTTKV